MPLQLIYTSAPRGVVAGRSGYCTVARSATLRESVMLQLEKWSHYQHLSLSGGQDRPIHCCRIIDVRGTRYHVLSRIQDAGLDFTGRTNFVAHHLVFTPEEVREFPSPAVILSNWTGWAKSWSQEPQILDTEDWSSLKALHQIGLLPAARWQRLTGDSANGYGLLDCRSGIVLRVDGVSAEDVLGLMGESLELLELRDPSHDFRATGWQYTFTTSLQEQDNPADFRWRCFHSDNPAAARFTGQDCLELIKVRPIRVTEVEASLAGMGRQLPRFIEQPKKTKCFFAETARFKAVAEGVPPPTYQWFSVDRNNNGKELPGEIDSELLISSAQLGVSRYVVRITNSAGEETSEVAELSCERRPVTPTQQGHERPVQVVRDPHAPRGLAGDRGIEESNRIQSSVPTRTADEIARNRSRIEPHVRDKKGIGKYIKKSNAYKLIALLFVIFACKKLLEPSIKIGVREYSGSQETEVPEIRGEFNVKEGVNIEFTVVFNQLGNRNEYKYQWYHGEEKLTNYADSQWKLMVTNVLGTNGNNYRVEVTKDSKTKKAKAKLNIQKVAALQAPQKTQGEEQTAAIPDKNPGSLGNENSGENDTTEISGWKHIGTGEANKGVKKFEPTSGKWLISDYKALGNKENEWVFIYKIDPMTNLESKIFELSFNWKDLNESEVGLMFRKGDQTYFHGLAGTNFVSFRLDGTKVTSLHSKNNKNRINIKPDVTNFILRFHVSARDHVFPVGGKNEQQTNTILSIRCQSTEAEIDTSCVGPSDYGSQNWQIGYAFATGKSPKESQALTISINPN
jgi:hypothetical protein